MYTIWDVFAGLKSPFHARGTHMKPDIMMSVEDAEKVYRSGTALAVNDGRHVTEINTRLRYVFASESPVKPIARKPVADGYNNDLIVFDERASQNCIFSGNLYSFFWVRTQMFNGTRPLRYVRMTLAQLLGLRRFT